MAKSKRAKLKHKVSLLTNEYLVIRSSMGLLLISMGVLFLAPLKDEGDFSKLMLSIIYSIVMVLWLVLIAEFVFKTMKLQDQPKVAKYSAIVAINSIFGLFLPMLISRLLLNHVMMDFLGSITHNGSTFCKVRTEIIGYYRYLQIDSMLSNLAFWIVLIAVALLMWGGLFERISRK